MEGRWSECGDCRSGLAEEVCQGGRSCFEESGRMGGEAHFRTSGIEPFLG